MIALWPVELVKDSVVLSGEFKTYVEVYNNGNELM